MQRKLVLYLLIFLVIACSFSGLLPYPIFSRYTNLTEANMYEINNFYESELNTQTPSNAKVLNLDWFDITSSLLPINKELKIIDIISGKFYYVMRIGGTNHADVETINSQNTQTFKDIYDGNWSWSRRPVWVQLDDKTFLCGSINGYPHGQSYIENSNLGGHTCIHFKNSKTHGTKKVDEDHQSCVKYAYAHRNEIEKYLK